MPEFSRPAAIAIVTAGIVIGTIVHPSPAGSTEGPGHAVFEARNGSSHPISCTAQIAHWYSVPLGRAEPGGAVRAELISDAPTGAVFLENGVGDRLPVEALWCGFEGREWKTRSLMPLAKRRGEALAELVVSCGDEGGHLRCR